MRRWSLLSVVPVLALSAAAMTACKDEAADPFVDEVINWQLSCTSGAACLFKAHQQNDTVEISVTSCSRDSTGLSFTVEASPDEGRGIPGSTITVDRLDPAQNTCIVAVSDSQQIGTSAVVVQDSCKGTAGNQGCEITGSLDSDGWDFAGTILCKNMKQDGDPERSYKLANADGSLGVPIKIDNCD